VSVQAGECRKRREFLIRPELDSGALRIVKVGAEAQSAQIHVAYPTARGASAKVRALIECLRDAFGDPPYWARP